MPLFERAYLVILMCFEKTLHLFQAQIKVKPGSYRARLTCLQTIVLKVPDILKHEEVLQVLPSLIGEAILSLKEASRKTRDAGYELLISLGKRMLGDTSIDTQQQSLMTEYIFMILAGLAGNTPVIF